MTSPRIQRLRGTHDIFAADALLFQKMEGTARKVFNRYGFGEIRTPILEEKELFTRALGTETDVVQKEMYDFTDRSKTHVAMRPEGTAGIVRAYLENDFDKREGLSKFYYIGPMFRSERPQAGRLRQFHQIGVEQIGTDDPLADAETIHALTVFLDEVGASGYELKLNNLGTFEERKIFREKLSDFFKPHKKELCEDCQRRLETNVFRILDCKVESCRAILRRSPSIQGFLTDDSLTHHKKVCDALTAAGIAFTEDPYMVRGLDYYTRTVFELSHKKLGAQDAIAAGGRYDSLVETFGGTKAGAVGFAIGLERLAMCLAEEPSSVKTYEESFFIVALGDTAFKESLKILYAVRSAGVKALMDYTKPSMKSQLRSADKERCRYAVILGDNELQKGVFVLKNLEVGAQNEYPWKDVIEICKKKQEFPMKTSYRSHHCGELNEKNIGEVVTLGGWVDSERDHGGILFVDLRDRYGKTQLVLDPKALKMTAAAKPEETLRIKGIVQKRPAGTENTKIVTGHIEVHVSEVTVLSTCQTPPFEITKSQDTNEDLRLQYRYLDLRNPAVQKNLIVRHRLYQAIRQSLDAEQFIEVETPILTKSTPEGARDYLVPSRVNQGEFYALPQSPQLFKQILMVAGFDRYFQIAKCFRDEDLRSDRQPEFTQLDMEMSFIKEEDIFGVVERTLKNIFKEVMGQDLPAPFPRLTYKDAMEKYGSDKPDLRFDVPIRDISDIAKESEFKVFKEAAMKEGGAVLGLCITKADASRKEIDTLTEFAKSEGALGLAYFKVEQGKLEAPIAKFFSSPHLEAIKQRFEAKDGDLIVFAADDRHKGQKVLGAIRVYASKWKGWVKPGTFHFSWITEFPLFKKNEEENRWDSEHHPFTSPTLEDWAKYKPTGEFGKIRSSAYDLVLNGNEIASGSIRIHDRELQREIFRTIGLDEKEAESRFGFLLKAFEYGPPPHGGIALGIDRIIAILLGLTSIRETIAFPKNQKAADPMTEAPSPVAERQLKELGIKLR